MGSNRPVNDNSDRVVSIPDGETSVFEFIAGGPDQPQNLKYAESMSASIKSNVEVTFWFEWGRFTDDFSALPHKGAVSTCTAGGNKSLKSDVVSGPGKARLVIDNSSGSTATVTRDVGVYG